MALGAQGTFVVALAWIGTDNRLFFVHLGQNSSGEKLKNYQNSSEKLPKLKQNFSKTQICGYNTRIKSTLTLLERDFTTNKTYK